MSKESKPAGGIKGFLQKTGKAGLWAMETGSSLAQWTYRYGGQAAFILATTSMVVLMPLLFEITREAQVSFDTTMSRHGVCVYFARSSRFVSYYIALACFALPTYVFRSLIWNAWKQTIFERRDTPIGNSWKWDLPK